MFKKWATLFTVLSFVVSSTACLSWSTREIRSEGDYPEPGSKVARVVKTDGEIVDFTGRGLGRRLHERVEGAALVPVEREVELQGPLTSIKKRADGTISEITDAAGRVHDVISVEREGPDRLVIKERRMETRIVSIPLSEVRLIKYRAVNGILTAMAVAAAGAAGLVGLAAYALSRE